MSPKYKGQITLAVAVLQMDMRGVLRRVKEIEGDFFVLILGMAISAGIMLGYIISYWLQK